MRVAFAGIAAVALLAATPAAPAKERIAPSEIQAGFFTGVAFTAVTPSNVKFKMVFTPDGKVMREPLGRTGFKGQGTWTLSPDGFCTTWKGSRPRCFVLIARGENKWSVMSGSSAAAEWSR